MERDGLRSVRVWESSGPGRETARVGSTHSRLGETGRIEGRRMDSGGRTGQCLIWVWCNFYTFNLIQRGPDCPEVGATKSPREVGSSESEPDSFSYFQSQWFMYLTTGEIIPQLSMRTRRKGRRREPRKSSEPETTPPRAVSGIGTFTGQQV